MVVSDMRKYMEATLEKMTPAKAQELARSVMQGQGKEQVQKFAQELMDWSTKNRERLREMIRGEVRSQLKSLGVATRDDLDDVKKRVKALERAAGTKRSTPRRSSAKRTTSGSSTSSSTPPKATG